MTNIGHPSSDLYSVLVGGFSTLDLRASGDLLVHQRALERRAVARQRPALAAARPEQSWPVRRRPRAGQEDQLFANDKLLFGSSYKEWKPAKHPFYGDIEIGGFVKESQRIPPTFMIEELCHRNAAFVIYHADQMPRLEFGDVEVKPSNGEVFTVTATVKNTRAIPSVAQQAANHNIGLPDVLSLEGPGLTVLAGGRLLDQYTGEIDAVERDPAHQKLNAGVPGLGSIRIRWLVKGTGEATLKHTSQKASTITKTVPIK